MGNYGNRVQDNTSAASQVLFCVQNKLLIPFSGLYPYTEDHVIHTKFKDSVSQHHTNFVFRHVMRLAKVPFLKNIFSLLPNLFQLP